MRVNTQRILRPIKLFDKAFRGYRISIITLIILGFLNGLLEGIGVNALIPMFSFVIEKQGGGSDIISQGIEKFFLYLNISFTLKYLLIFVSLLFVLKAIVLLLSNYLKIKITTDYVRQTRSELFRRTLESKWPYLLKQKIGYLEAALM